MYKFWASIRKEFLQLIGDRVGITLLFAMPLILVFIISIIQDSAYKLVNENQIALLVSNVDKGVQGDKLTDALESSGLFRVRLVSDMDTSDLKESLVGGDELLGLYIPPKFSERLELSAGQTTSKMLSEFGMLDSTEITQKLPNGTLHFYNDPVLQENYTFSVKNMIGSYMSAIETEMMLEQLYGDMGAEGSRALRRFEHGLWSSSEFDAAC